MIFTVVYFLLCNQAFGQCEKNIDTIKTFYINGMMTKVDNFEANKASISSFINDYLADSGFSDSVLGTHNYDEFIVAQLLEVFRQKIEDNNESLSGHFYDFINEESQYIDDIGRLEDIEKILEEIVGFYKDTLGEEDSIICI